MLQTSLRRRPHYCIGSTIDMADNWQEMEEAGRRALRYWYVDGLTEIGTGLVLALLGLLFWVEETAPDVPLAQATEFTMLVLVVGGGLLLRRLVETAKQHLTYRRTGYVSYRQPPRWRYWLGIAFAIAVGAAVAAFLAFAPGSVRWLPLLQGAVVAAALALTARRYGVVRLYLYAALSAALGIWIGSLAWSSELAAAVYYGAVGLALTFGGLVTLVLYLAHTRATEAD